MLRLHRIVVATCLGLALGASTLAAPVEAAPAVQTLKGSYTVQAGDYLSGIAMKLNVTLKDLLAVNGMTATSLILPGMQLKVPGAASTARDTVAAAPSAATTYTVVAGDYLTGIAGKLKVSTKALLVANKLSLNSLIWPGMRLVVPAGGTLPAAAAPSAGVNSSTTTPSTTKAPKGATYSVVNGDYLSGIAAKLGVSLTSLLTTNQMSVNSFIYPGMKLKVPAGGSVPQTAAPAAGAASSTSTSSGGAAASVPSGVAKVIAFARAQIGKPYKFNTAGPSTFDCSGLTLAAFATIGISLPHYSGAQMAFGTIVDWTTSAIRPGDLVFLESAPGSGVVSHVGIATSATTWIQAPRTGDVVREGSFSTVRIIGVRRLVNG
jgi:cell wall-associated NlpC family hydrolase